MLCCSYSYHVMRHDDGSIVDVIGAHMLHWLGVFVFQLQLVCCVCAGSRLVLA